MAMAHADHPPCRCGSLSVQLSAYLDGDLPPDLCRELEAHMGDCPDCQVVLDTLNRTIQIIRTLGTDPAPLPADVEARLLARLAG